MLMHEDSFAFCYFPSLSQPSSTRRCQSIPHVERFSPPLPLFPLAARITSSTIHPPHNKQIQHREKKKLFVRYLYSSRWKNKSPRGCNSHGISPGNHLIVTITSLGAETKWYDTIVIVKSFTMRISRNNKSRDWKKKNNRARKPEL